MSAEAPIDVAVGVVLDREGRFLIAQRPDGKPMAGYWEFPGGKLEPGESVFDALAREFDEELGFAITNAHPWAQRIVAYPHATVRLHFWRSFARFDEWQGTPTSREGQAFRWESIASSTTAPWLQGAQPVRRWLALPEHYAISAASTMGAGAFLARLDAKLKAGAIRLLQLREPMLDDDAFDALFTDVLARCRDADVRVVVSSRHDERYWDRADGVHLTAHDLDRCASRPAVDWCLASCHDADDLTRAGTIGADAATLGPVAKTPTHPTAAGIGWEDFARRIATTPVPVYALGGVGAADLRVAIEHGAHGVAMLRDAWC